MKLPDIVIKKAPPPVGLLLQGQGAMPPSCSVFPASLLKDSYILLIDFLSQISKLSYFNLLDLVFDPCMDR